MPRLEHKTAIVTGASHGIGKAIARIFGQEGARVFVVDIDQTAGEETANNIRSAGGAATFLRCDVSSAEEVQRVAKHASEQSGRIDVLCNNAAFLGEWHRATEASDAEWEKSFRVSLMGAHYFCREVLPLMVSRKSGSIINISSVQGLVGARNSIAYTSIKTAMIGLTRSIAYDYGPENVRCNALCPGAIQTRIAAEPGSELHQRQISKTFLGRIGEPHEVAFAALFLASDESSYITGAALPVDGGWTAM